MKQKNKRSDSRIRVADLILIIVSIILIFFSFIGFLMSSKGDWLAASLLTLAVGGVAALLLVFMIYAKKQTNHVIVMRILEWSVLGVFIILALYVALGPVNHAFTAMGASKELSGAISSDIQLLNESKKQFFANERQNIADASSTLENISGTFIVDDRDVRDVERTMNLKNGRHYGSQAELRNLSNSYAAKYEEKLERKSFAHNQVDALINEANEMKRDVDAGFFFSFPSIAVSMDSLSSRMARLQNAKSQELGVRTLEKHGAKYSAPILASTYRPVYERSSFSERLFGLSDDSIAGICIGFLAMICLLAVYIAQPRSKGIRPNRRHRGEGGLPL